jgi:glutathione S-transferase
MIQYLASKAPESGLAGRDAHERAEVLQWMFWESTTWDPPVATLAFERLLKPLLNIGEPDASAVSGALERSGAAAAILDTQLKGRAFVCGAKPSLADFALGSALILEERAQLPFASFPEIQRWGASLKALPAWGATLAQQAQPAAA